MNGRSLIAGFVVGVLMAKAYTAQIAQLLLLGDTAYVYGAAVQGVQGQLLNATVVVDHVQLAVGTVLICAGVLGMSLLWPAMERVVIALAVLLQSIKEVAERSSGEATWHG
jgi:hypothetical protein